MCGDIHIEVREYRFNRREASPAPRSAAQTRMHLRDTQGAIPGRNSTNLTITERIAAAYDHDAPLSLRAPDVGRS